MSEKTDLAEMADEAGEYDSDDWVPMRACEVLALVRAVRAAKEFVEHQAWLLGYQKMQPLRDALAPFTDSADSAETSNG